MGRQLTELVVDYGDYRLQARLQQRLAKEKNCWQDFPSVLHCNCSMLPGYKFVDLNRYAGEGATRADFGNLSHCHNHWTCPTCSAYYLSRLGNGISLLLAEKDLEDVWAFSLTLTIPHNRFDSARSRLELLKACKRRIKNSRVQRMAKAIGICGSITATECTYSRIHGWHFHQHVVFLIPRANWHYVEDFAERYSQTWRRAVVTLGGYPEDYGQHSISQPVYLSRTEDGQVLRVNDGRYILDFGSEIVKPDGKSNAATTGASVFSLIEGTDEDFDKFVEFAKAVKGAQRVTCSNGLRRRVDELLQESKENFQSANTEREVVCSWCAADWREIIVAEKVTGIYFRMEFLQIVSDGSTRREIDALCRLWSIPLPLPPQRQFPKSQAA